MKFCGFTACLFIVVLVSPTFCEEESCPAGSNPDGSKKGCGCGSEALNRNSKSKDSETPDAIVEDDSDNAIVKPKSETAEKAPGNKFDNMVLLDGGKFIMGTEEPFFHADGEGPTRPVILDPFYMDVTEVSNQDFAKFVEETKYATEAETFGNSFVFFDMMTQEQQDTVNESVAAAPWWYKAPNAHWKEPEGIKSNIDDR